MAILFTAPVSLRTYETSFPTVENPINESSNWLNGAADGLDWQNTRVISAGKVCGDATTPSGYSDPTSILKNGLWRPDQQVEATIIKVGTNSDTREYELRLRSTCTSHSSRGYEFLFNDAGNFQLVRWNGAVGDFTVIDGASFTAPTTGDIFKATFVGTTWTAYVNGVQIGSGTEATYNDGNPGFGFFSRGGDITSFGFSHFKAIELD